jgi:hypothetical protein
MYLTGDMYWDQDKNKHYIHGKRKYVHVNPKEPGQVRTRRGQWESAESMSV